MMYIVNALKAKSVRSKCESQILTLFSYGLKNYLFTSPMLLFNAKKMTSTILSCNPTISVRHI